MSDTPTITDLQERVDWLESLIRQGIDPENPDLTLLERIELAKRWGELVRQAGS
jgi:hypothetical protein